MPKSNTKTIIYLVRNSKVLRNYESYINNKDYDDRLESVILSVEGEILANKLADNLELKEIDVIYSSNYSSALSTAKYIAKNNDLSINVDFKLGERKVGVKKLEQIPKDFYDMQLHDFDYKMNYGESINDVCLRMYQCLLKIIDANKGKKIAIVTHSTCMLGLLSKYCSINFNNNVLELTYNNKVILEDSFSSPDLYELEYVDNKLIDIKKIIV